MVVDDHPMWRDAVERDLRAAGHDVVAVAANGREAMARFPAAAPQVVVLDLQLPDGDAQKMPQGSSLSGTDLQIILDWAAP